MSLAVLSICAVTDIRCSYCPWLFGTDASPYAAGIVRSEVGDRVAAELWCLGELQGFHANVMESNQTQKHEAVASLVLCQLQIKFIVTSKRTQRLVSNHLKH
eukprot:4957271-Amphidinium_carterae.2